MDLYLIRHPRPDIAAGVCYGQLDVPLCDPCNPAFGDVLRKLPPVECVWTSPLLRCRRLAGYIAAANRAELLTDARWCELSFGQWEGRRWTDIDRTTTARWLNDYWNIAPPDGETYSQLHARVSSVLAALLAGKTQRVALVSHAGPIRTLLAICLGLEPRRYPALSLAYGSVSLLRARGDGWSLEYVNT